MSLTSGLAILHPSRRIRRPSSRKHENHQRGYLPLHTHITYSVPGKVTTQLQIEKHHTNRLEILHGGTIATMVDLGGYISQICGIADSDHWQPPPRGSTRQGFRQISIYRIFRLEEQWAILLRWMQNVTE
jgi:hypothetical protein